MSIFLMRAKPTGPMRLIRVLGVSASLAVAAIARAQCPITFAPYVSMPMGGLGINVGDFNRDGRLDLVGLSNIQGAGSVTIRFANPNFPGGYDPAISIPLGLNPTWLAVADFNHDGTPDIAAAYSPGGAVSSYVAIILSNGNGTFQPVVNYPASGGKVTVADLNHDGNPDIIQMSGPGGITVLYGNANGTFVPYAPLLSTPASTIWAALAIGDLNNDGALDLVIPGSVQPSANGFIGVSLGTTPNSVPFGPVNTLGTTFFGTSAAALGHFNHDGKLDVVAINPITSGRLQLYLGDGAGGLTASVTRTAGLNSTAIAVGDFNLDGNPDVVVANQNAASVTIFLGDGNGGLSNPGTSFAVTATPGSIAIADLNNDGRPDIVTGSGPGGDASLLLSSIPILTFTVQPSPRGTCTGGSAPFALTIAGQVTTPTFRWQFEDGAGNWLNLTTDPIALPFGGTAFITNPLVTGQSASVNVNVRNRNGDFRIRCVASSSCTSGISAAVRLHVGCDSIANIVTIGGATTCDDELTADDVIAFLSGFFAQQPISDIARLGGVIGPDGQWTADDVVAFLSAFFAGCP